MDYLRQLVVSGGGPELKQHIRRQQFGLIVSACPPDVTSDIISADASDIPHYQSGVFAVETFVLHENRLDPLLRQRIVESFSQTARQIEQSLKAGQAVLIHCSAGLHRSPAIALAAMLSMGVDTKEALKALYKIRPAAKYNGFNSKTNWVAFFQKDVLGRADVMDLYMKQHRVLAVASYLSAIINSDIADDYPAAIDVLTKAYETNTLIGLNREEGAPVEDDIPLYIGQAKDNALALTGAPLCELVKRRLRI